MNTILSMNAQQYVEYQRLCSSCFTYPYVAEGEPASAERLAQTRAAFDEKGDMLGGMTAHDFTIRFGEQDVKMAGIGGVVTYPEKRRGGAIRSIFEALLPQLYEQGYTFSALYPFSHVFYRKFGYEFCFEQRQIITHPEELACYPAAGRVRLMRKGDDLSPLLKVYEGYRRRLDFTLLRTEKDYEEHLKKDPAVDFHALYLWKNDAGEAQGYVVLQTQVHGKNDKTLLVEELAYTTREALCGLLSFLHSFNSYRDMQLSASPLEDWNTLLPEPYEVHEQINHAGMARVVNVKKALSLLCCPPVNGSLTLKVKDEQIEQNNRPLCVGCQDGRLTVKETDEEPELCITVQTFAQLMTGRLNMQTLRACSRDEGMRCANPLLPYLFPQRLCWMNRYF